MSFKLITSPFNREFRESAVEKWVFLGGGIQKCPDWQSEIAAALDSHLGNDASESVIAFNPRQPNFNMNDPLAGERQIRWEFRYLNVVDIFTMFFYGPTESDQPICFYELGRYVEVMKRRFPADWRNRIVISTSTRFRRFKDVVIQSKLAGIDAVAFDDFGEMLDSHAVAVWNAVKRIGR